jgi:EAL domain-containing protein (putative c-di-GMP-specific phosphodiesterase class I)
VLEEAVRQLRPHAALLAERPVVFTINLSGQSLSDPEFPHFLVDLVRNSGVNPRVFCFEITESAAIANLTKAEDLMRRLRAMGCEFALDDFGTGLSSLAYLRSLPVDMLKIDGSFVRDILKDPRAESMVQAIAHLSRSMNLVTVAEYVETDEIRLRVATLGVDYGQGFAIARPVPLSETVLELAMYSSAALHPAEAASGGEIVLEGDDLDITLDAGNLDRIAREQDAQAIEAHEDTHRRLEIILGSHDHSESVLYQRSGTH